MIIMLKRYRVFFSIKGLVMKFTSVIILVLFLCSCVVLQSYSGIKPGDVLWLKKTLVIPADKASVMYQYGEISTASEIEVYDPRCWFVSRVIKTKIQTINPDRFRILKIRDISSTVQHATDFPFASLSFPLFLDNLAVEYFTEMDISSETQPEFHRLICSYWGDSSDEEYLSIKQINAALKGIAIIISQ